MTIFAFIEWILIFLDMKKLLVLLFAAIALAIPRAQAQDMFNHMSLGVTVGLTDGFGLDIAMPMGSKFQLRAGYAIDPIGLSFDIENLGSMKFNGKDYQMKNVPVSVSSWKSGNGHLMADFYPGKGGFHLSAGAFVNNGKFISAVADLSKVLDREDWGASSVNGVSTDKNAQAYMDVKTWAVMPYVGLGFGRALNPEKTFNFVFDMGLLVWGSPQLQSRKYTLSSNYENYDSVPITSQSLGLKEGDTAAQLMDLVSAIPVCPYLRFGFYFKLF
jgi:hypothetical protein